MNTTNNQIPAWMASSTDVTLVSSRVTGAVVAASSAIIFIAAQLFHIQLSANDVITLATELGTLAGSIWFVKGIIIWILTKFGKQTPSQTV